ncbi:putative dna repair protein rad8 protein [Daldinia childiae]|uniref:putative dna repair protein rad8 protein n=1 Tax=Daldinia childiae TaxID=326645 RepID=UPI0014471292|nr:putative dna repair protein rad8 protein [Daldinia childiae]KAF3058655.1 putative dna repair protein rad8 protein [Daldinia childiae]
MPAYGKYYHQPDCDAPENSLHVLGGRKLFLFKESTRTGTPDRDGYVISEECRLLESHEYREVLLKFKACVDLQKLDLGRGILDARVDGFWVSPQAIYYGLSSTVTSHKRLECFKVPNSQIFIVHEEDPEQQVLAEALFAKDKHCDQYGIIGKYESLSGITGNWVTIEKFELPQFHDFVSHINVKLASLGSLEVVFQIADIKPWIKRLEHWKTRVDIQDSPFGQLPRAQWLQVSFNPGGKRKPATRWIQHHHSDAIAAFESHAKKQIPPFEVRVKVHPTLLEDVQLGYQDKLAYDGQFVAVVQYLINHKTLARMATAYLPPTKNPYAEVTAYTRVERNAILSENMQVNSSSGKHSFVPFRESLKSLAGSLHPVSRLYMDLEMRSFRTKLSKSQLLSLGWTLWRELLPSPFTEREIEEEIVSDLKLRLIGCAERKAGHSGGILADDVGYGKTIIMLALMHCLREWDEKYLPLRTDKNPCRIHLNASLVLVPSHLVDQWADEAKKFLPIEPAEIVKIKNLGDLRDNSSWRILKKLQRARLIIVNVQCIASIGYYQNLAKLAGSLDPPCHGENFRKGASTVPFQSRAFEDWYKDATSVVGDYVGKLLRMGIADYFDVQELVALYSEIEDRRNAHREVYKEFSKNYENSVINSATPVQPEASQRFNSPWQMIPQLRSERAGKKFSFIPKTFNHVLEAFTFSRVIYDEFSYEGLTSTLFVANLEATSKWVLSATPPTRDLAAVCYTAKHFNVHVARPIHRRQGMPRITYGPELEDRSSAEDLQILKFSSDQAIRERHEQGMKFLEKFATSNPLDRDLAGGIEVEEKVVVCEMNPHEFVHYHDLEQDLRAHNFDANMLPKESRVFLEPLVSNEWGADGKQVGTRALIHRSSQGNWQREGYSMSSLIEQRRSVCLNALQVFKITAEKAIWLSKRIWDNEEEKKFVNGRNATTDIYMLLRDIWKKNLVDCGGLDAWRELSREVVTKEGMQYEEMVRVVETSHPNFCMNEETFFDALNTLTANTWVDYYNLESKNLKAIGEQEATTLLQDLSRVNDGEGKDLIRGNMKTSLSILIKKGLEQYRRPKETIKSLETKITHEQVEEADKKNKSCLESLCRSTGLSFGTSAKKGDLKKLLISHVNGELEESSYVGYLKCEAMNTYRYPLLGETTKIRGGKYTLTGNDVSNTSVELRQTFEKVIYAIKQERITKNLMSDKRETNCDLCGQMVPREDLHIVCQCGHLLCKKHLNSVYCGGDDSERCSSLLKDATMSLKMINNPQRCLDLDFGTQMDAPCPKISSKFQMLANVAKAIPDDEFGLVFFQYNSQLEELKYTLRKNGIGFYHITDTELKSLSKVNDKMRPLDKLNSLGQSSLRDRCDERGLQWSEKESVAELRRKIRGWMGRFGNGVKHPKLRLLQINDVTSAGSNFQYANHVMFINPFVVDLQETYDSCMKQAVGRCVRYGQKKKVKVYHFVTANTIEVDILELRTKSHVLVRPGKAIGRLQPAPIGEDTLMPDAPGISQPGNDDSEERIRSNLTTQDIWKAMNEQNWLTTVGIEY